MVEIVQQTCMKIYLTAQKQKASQFPLILAYVVTCNESHCHYALLTGLVLIFYVAISRVKTV